VTFKHVGENINNGGSGFDPRNLPEFLLAQFGVFGPVTFAVLLVAIARMRSAAVTRADRLMLAFAIPPLALIVALSLFTHVNANWAAPSFISAVIVAAAILVRNAAWRLLIASLAIGVVVQIALLAGDAVATRLGLPRGLGGDAYHRTLGWRTLGDMAGRLAQKTGARTLSGEDRNVVAALAYYWRDRPQQIVQWPSAGPAQFDLTRAMTAGTAEPILMITDCPYPERLARFYDNVVPLGRIDTPTGPTSQRSFFAFELSERSAPLAALASCAGSSVPGELQRLIVLP